MKKILGMAILAGLASTPLAAGGLSRQDRELLLNHLQNTRQALLEAVDGLSDQQATFRAGPDRWTIAECVEHLAVVEEAVRARVAALLESPPEPAKSAKVADDQVLEFTANRERKFQAPEPVRPLHRFDGLEGALRAFMEERVKTLEFLADTQSDLRAYTAPGPAGDLDGVQWGLFLSGHTARHTQQILEVKANPDFPGSM